MSLKDKLGLMTESKKMSKSKFSKLYKDKKLGFVVTMSRKADKMFDKLKGLKKSEIQNFQSSKPSTMDLDSQLKYGLTTTVSSEEIHGYTFYVVQHKMDNSKNPNNSWDTLDYVSTLYIQK